MISKLIKWFKGETLSHKVIPRAKHGISRQQISNNALKVLYRLHKSGYSAYLVGGCIRDLMLGIQPKDFDIATDAEPEQISKLFTNCRLIGRRFRLAHVHFGREIIEVATFRASHAPSNIQNHHGMILRDNVYGSIQEDVLRRDFTVNALYYNIADFTVEDFVGGLHDLNKRQINLIGEPETRYREDPVRMLRAIRFAAKLKFTLHPHTAKPIHDLNELLTNIPAARLFEEYCKLFLSGHAESTYEMLCEYGLFARLFPRTAKFTPDNKLIKHALSNTDARHAAGKSIAPSFLLAVFMWQPMLERAKHFMHEGESEFVAYNNAMERVLSEQQKVMAVPRRFLSMIRDVWDMQLKLERRRSARQVTQLFTLSKFRAGYDFLLLRAEAGDRNATEPAVWWQQFVEGNDESRAKLTAGVKDFKKKSKRKPRSKHKPAKPKQHQEQA